MSESTSADLEGLRSKTVDGMVAKEKSVHICKPCFQEDERVFGLITAVQRALGREWEEHSFRLGIVPDGVRELVGGLALGVTAGAFAVASSFSRKALAVVARRNGNGNGRQSGKDWRTLTAELNARNGGNGRTRDEDAEVMSG